jgi:hypothetical protein
VGEGESQEQEKQEGQGLKYPSVRLSTIWLVRILWFLLIGGWGRRRIQARLEAGPWPWKRTETHRRHYCQQELFARAGFEPWSSWSLPPESLGLLIGMSHQQVFNFFSSLYILAFTSC